MVGDEICAFSQLNGESLLVFAPDAYGLNEPARIVVEERTVKAGDRIAVTGLSELDEGFECGGVHYDSAYLVPVLADRP